VVNREKGETVTSSKHFRTTLVKESSRTSSHDYGWAGGEWEVQQS